MAAVEENPYQPPREAEVDAEDPLDPPLRPGLYPLVRVANVCLRLYFATTVYSVVDYLYRIVAKGGIQQSLHDSAYNSPSDWLNLLMGLASLASTVLFLIWKYRAAANARVIDPDQMKISPGMAVGAYFIPLANLVIPYRAMAGIARASRVDRFWVGAWWVAYLGNWAWIIFVTVMAIDVVYAGGKLRQPTAVLYHLVMLWSVLTFYFFWQIMVRVTHAQMAPARPGEAAIPA